MLTNSLTGARSWLFSRLPSSLWRAVPPLVWETSGSPDGKRVVKISSSHGAKSFYRRISDGRIEGSVCVYDAQTGQPVTEPMKHPAPVLCATLSPDGRWMVTGSEDGSARVWDARTGQLLMEPLRHGGSVVAAKFSSDGTRVLTTSDDCTASVWDVKPGKALPLPLRSGGRVSNAKFGA